VRLEVGACYVDGDGRAHLVIKDRVPGNVRAIHRAKDGGTLKCVFRKDDGRFVFRGQCYPHPTGLDLQHPLCEAQSAALVKLHAESLREAGP